MHSARLDRQSLPVDSLSAQKPHKHSAVPNPNAAQAAAYIHDMSSAMRDLAVRHNLTTLVLLLEMAAVEAGSMRPPYV